MLLALDSRYPPNLKGFDKWLSDVPKGTHSLLGKENLELIERVFISVNGIWGEISERHSLSHVLLEGLQQILPSRKFRLGRTNKAGKSQKRAVGQQFAEFAPM
jgi:hypothetical protein